MLDLSRGGSLGVDLLCFDCGLEGQPCSAGRPSWASFRSESLWGRERAERHWDRDAASIPARCSTSHLASESRWSDVRVRRRVCAFGETGMAYRSFVGLLSVRFGVGLGLARAAM